jgi:transposase InsO family protein
MSWEFENPTESGTERRRSRSEVPDSVDPSGLTSRSGIPYEGYEEGTTSRSGKHTPPRAKTTTRILEGMEKPSGVISGMPAGDEEAPVAEAGRGVEGPPDDASPPPEPEGGPPAAVPAPGLPGRPRGGRRLAKAAEEPRSPLTAEQRLLVLDTWRRSGLPAGDFAALVGISKFTLYNWKHRFQKEGPAGLSTRQRGGPKGSRLPEVTRRTILMLKEANPAWGTERISAVLARGPALAASPGAVARVLKEEGYQLEESPTRPHPDHPREFERAKPCELWQTDLFTFILKRQNRRVYLVTFMDDHSRFIVGYGLHASQSAVLVLEVLRSALANYSAPAEILTDNGTQYITWRGKGIFTKELEKRGIRQIVASPRHPQTLGKVERFWGSLWRECVEAAVFLDLADASRRIGLYIDHYNFERPHQGIGGLTPADRFFGAAPEVLRSLKERVAANALSLARHGVPRAPFYLTGQVGGKSFSVHAEGERVILRHGAGEREEVSLAAPEGAREASGEKPGGEVLAVPESAVPPAELPEPLCPSASPSEETPDEEPPAPGVSPLDDGLQRIEESLREEDASEGGAQ